VYERPFEQLDPNRPSFSALPRLSAAFRTSR
jgi:hypothetical protein